LSILSQNQLNENVLPWSGDIWYDAIDIDFAVGGGVVMGTYGHPSAGSGQAGLVARYNDDGEIPAWPSDDEGCTIDRNFYFNEIDVVVDESVFLSDLTTEPEEHEVIVYEQQHDSRPYCKPCVMRVNKMQTENPPDGLMWQTAFTDIQSAINAAYNREYCEVWVAKALEVDESEEIVDSYYFIYSTGNSNHVQLRKYVHVYGGFEGMKIVDPYPGSEYGWESSRDQRNFNSNITVISGGDGVLGSDNYVFHVVRGEDESTLDGFVVIEGRASGPFPLQRIGGGMLNVGKSPVIENCVFIGNVAYWGGAIANINAAPRIENCDFYNPYNPGTTVSNFAMYGGGAMLNLGGTGPGVGPTVINTRLIENWALAYGGAVLNYNSPATFSDCIINDNRALYGGGMMNSQVLDGFGAPYIESCYFQYNRAENM